MMTRRECEHTSLRQPSQKRGITDFALSASVLLSMSWFGCGGPSDHSDAADDSAELQQAYPRASRSYDRDLYLSKSCFCANCVEDQGPWSATDNLDAIAATGCLYVKGGFAPWQKIARALPNDLPAINEQFFAGITTAVNVLGPNVIVDFGLQEIITENYVESLRLTGAERTTINELALSFDREFTGAEESFDFDAVDRRATRPGLPENPWGNEPKSRNGVPTLLSKEGWQYHVLLAMRAIDAGARGIALSQVHLRLGPATGAPPRHLESFVRAVRHYAATVHDTDIIIGVEAIGGYYPNGAPSGLYDWTKFVTDIDVARGSVGNKFAYDARTGTQVPCHGQSFLGQVDDAHLNDAGALIGELCLVKGVGENLRVHYESDEPTLYPDFDKNNPSNIPMIIELDGCQECTFRDLRSDATNIVYYQYSGTNLTTSCYPEVRGGLTTTMLFLSQPKQIRAAFNLYMARTTSELRAKGMKVYYAPKMQAGQNNYYQIHDNQYHFSDAEIARLRGSVRLCPETDDGPSLDFANHRSLLYNAEFCDDLIGIQSAFRKDSRRLNVQKSGTGNGTVTSNPSGINCGTNCTENYAAGTSVTLTAQAASDSTFSGWSGGCTGSKATCTITMSQARSVGATFSAASPTTYALQVAKQGNGSGSVASSPSGISCGSDCTEIYAAGTSVTLTAQAASGSTFSGWSGGGCSGSNATCTITMSQARSVGATFSAEAPTTYALQVTKPGNGSGSVTSSPSGISCGSDCTEIYAAGTLVTLTAQAASGSTFSGWSGGCIGSNATCTITMSQARSVGATFSAAAPTTYALQVAKQGNGSGSVTSSPSGISCGSDCSESYAAGTSVTLTAQAASGSTFSGWSGGCSGINATCTTTMNGASSVTASFALDTKVSFSPGTFLIYQSQFAQTANLVLYMQTDGNLVLYRKSGGTVLWSSGTAGRTCNDSNLCKAMFQGDGNLVISQGTAFWHSGTYSQGATELLIQESKPYLSIRAGNTTLWVASAPLNVIKQGSGSGSVTSSPSGISCGSDCSESYAAGTLVTLTAHAPSGSKFSGWSGGGCSGNALTCTTTMNGARTVTAAFALDTKVSFSPGTFLIKQNQYAETANFRLYMQTDGNLVLYRKSTGAALWSSGTSGRTCNDNNPCKAKFQGDGNLVISQGAPLWFTGTENKGATAFVIQEATPYLSIVSSSTVLWKTP
ncbi:MAG: hypothetical protein H6729_05925 [Deltaproteobacteria bacterium]|nr:hypothetical protein [Deltaproteobacteria bacterium]